MREIKRLVQCRYLGPGEGWGELGSRIERANLVEGVLVYLAGAIGGAIKRVVVHDDELTVGGGADVEFEVVGAGVDRGLKGRHCIFGVMKMLATMGDNLDFCSVLLRGPRLRIFLCPLYVAVLVIVPASESKATDEKQHARVLSACNRAEGLRVGQGCSQAGELRMVEGVVRIGAEGEGCVLPKRDIAHEAEVAYILAGAVERCSWCVAEGILRRDGKGRCIEPLLYRARTAGDRWIANLRRILAS